MKKSTRVFLIIICVLFIMLSATGVIWVFINKYGDKAYAEDNGFVVFNQYILDTYVHNYNLPSSASVQLTNEELQIDHQYYIKVQVYKRNGGIAFEAKPQYSVSAFHEFSPTSVNGYNLLYEEIYSQSTYNNWKLTIYSNSSGNTIINAMCVDLTQMYGAGNEISLAECQSTFNLDYYAYTTGTIIQTGNTDYMQGYQNGIRDFQNSITATFNNDILGSIAYPANISGFTSSIDYSVENSFFTVEGITGIHLGSYLTSPIRFYAEYYYPNYEGGLYLAFFKYDNELTPIYVGEITPSTASTPIYVQADFSISNCDTLYFGVFNDRTNLTVNNCITTFMTKSELTILNIDVAALVSAAIGQTKALYIEGGEKYEEIYYLGFNEGVAHGNATLETMDYIGAAFIGIGSILQIELLPGIPFSLFVLLPLMFGLIAFVVKLSKGGSS